MQSHIESRPEVAPARQIIALSSSTAPKTNEIRYVTLPSACAHITLRSVSTQSRDLSEWPPPTGCCGSWSMGRSSGAAATSGDIRQTERPTDLFPFPGI